MLRGECLRKLRLEIHGRAEIRCQTHYDSPALRNYKSRRTWSAARSMASWPTWEDEKDATRSSTENVMVVECKGAQRDAGGQPVVSW